VNYSKILILACLALQLFPGASGSQSQQSPGPGAKPATAMPDEIPIPPAAEPSSQFNVEAATDAYLAEIPRSARAKSDDYFEGGYWLILWDFLYGAVVYLLLLHFRWSAMMRDLGPGPVEEWIFFDHPSGRNRIRAAMRWKAENLSLFAPNLEQ
jgi:hypothetical protein